MSRSSGDRSTVFPPSARRSRSHRLRRLDRQATEQPLFPFQNRKSGPTRSESRSSGPTRSESRSSGDRATVVPRFPIPVEGKEDVTDRQATGQPLQSSQQIAAAQRARLDRQVTEQPLFHGTRRWLSSLSPQVSIVRRPSNRCSDRGQRIRRFESRTLQRLGRQTTEQPLFLPSSMWGSEVAQRVSVVRRPSNRCSPGRVAGGASRASGGLGRQTTEQPLFHGGSLGCARRPACLGRQTAEQPLFHR